MYPHDVACIIIGIDGWEKYTAPLVRQIAAFERMARVVVIDNASPEPYPPAAYVHRTERLSYAAAINRGKEIVGPAQWTVVLSNDVRCKGTFYGCLAMHEDAVLGPKIMQNHGYEYVEGWCVAVPEPIWQAVGGWDERFQVSSWEDVDFSQSVKRLGYSIGRVPLPFDHLDQRQRFFLPEYGGTEAHNYALVLEKHGPPL